MNLIFNEVSFLPNPKTEQQLLHSFISLASLFAKCKSNYGFKHIVFPTDIGEIKISDNKTFFDWVYNISDPGKKNLFLSLIKKPFVRDILDGSIDIINEYYFVSEEYNIPETYCSGLAVAYERKLLTISLNTCMLWEATTISFKKIINENFETHDVLVNNISLEHHLVDHTILDFINSKIPVQLIETAVDHSIKSISLRDDHGYDRLLSFAKKLVKSTYVTSVINSLPFNPNSVNFIRKIYSDGKIEIVMHWEDAGIGLIIQSTGRSYSETEQIAQILKSEFDK